MSLRKNHHTKWILLFYLPFTLILFLSHTPLHAQWTAVTPPDVFAILEDVHFTSATEGWVVGWDDFRGVLFHYHNGAWTSVTPPDVSARWELYGVHFASATEGWAVGYDVTNYRGVLLHYHNGTWTSVTPPDVSADWWLNSVHFTSATEGWAVGWDDFRGVLFHYHNGAWTSVTPPDVSARWELYGVHFASATEGWAVGIDETNDRGVLLHYHNGTWTSVTPPDLSAYRFLYGVHFTSATEGWAVGVDYTNSQGLLLHYHNGAWTQVTPPDVSAEWTLDEVHFTSADEGWAVGWDWNQRGLLLHYHNGAWTQVTPPDVSTWNWELRSVHFTSANEGWAVGRDSTNDPRVLLHYSSVSDKYGLTIAKDGSGTGTVTSSPSGIECGLDCAQTYESGTTVVLTAAADTGSTFAGWSGGGCSGTGTCEVTMNSDITVTATFTLSTSPTEISPKEGTIGTEIVVTGSGFDTKKGKVLIGDAAAKIISWTPTLITGEIKKALPPGIAYDVVLQLKAPKEAAPIRLSKAFTMMAPEITSVDPVSGSNPDEIEISGNYFGTKKGKVFLEYEQSGIIKKKNCKVTEWGMDSITFVVPKTSKRFTAKEYLLRVTNKVGEDSSAFTVE